MSLENGRLITDGEMLEPCCEDAEFYCEFDDFIGCSTWNVCGEKPNYEVKWFVSMKGIVDSTCIKFCPFCGAKLEFRKSD